MAVASSYRPSMMATAWVAVLASACQAEHDPMLMCERIVNGAEHPSVVGLEEVQASAVVAVHPHHRETICTGVFVTPEVVVTAAHCVDPQDPEALAIGDWESPEDSISPLRLQLHPQLDVAVLWVDPNERPSGAGWILPYDGVMDESWLDRPVELAGVGTTEHGTVGALRFVAEPVVDLRPTTFIVDGRGQTGACGGDSGGPALAHDASGRLRVVGLLDTGDPSCVDQDVYTRVDVLRDWWPFEWRHRGDPQESGATCDDDPGLVP